MVKRFIDAFNRRDLDAIAELTTPDFELYPGLVGAVTGSSFRGREGIESYAEELLDTWDDVQLVPEEFRDLGDSVLVFMRIDGRGRSSGVPVSGRQAVLWDFRDGKGSRLRAYLDRGEALRAAGLSE